MPLPIDKTEFDIEARDISTKGRKPKAKAAEPKVVSDEPRGLPKIDVPIYKINIPSSGQEITVRPFTVKEEKLLFMALESKSVEDVTATTKQVINNCIIQGDVNIEKLPFFDIDYLFIFLRAKSIGEAVDIRMTCNNVLEDGNVCGNVFRAGLNISNVEIVKDEEMKNDFRLNKDKGVIMKYPTYAVVKTIEAANTDLDKKTALIISSIDRVYDKTGYYSSSDYTKDQLVEFVEGLTEENYKRLEEWVDNFPVFVARIKETCTKCGFEHDVRYSDFYDFFY